MSRRRRNQQSSPLKGIATAAAVLVAIAAAAFFFRSSGSDKPTGDYTPLPIDTYYANSQNLIGNNYSLRGNISRRDRITDKGEIITLNVQTPSGTVPLPVLIPKDATKMNLEVGHSIQMNVNVNSEGIPEATAVSAL